MEFIQHGNLQQHVEKGVLSDPEAASVTAQVAQALEYMHEKHFIHRDIKPMVNHAHLPFYIGLSSAWC